MADSAKQQLPKTIFEVEVPNHQLVKQAYETYLSNSRLASATTKQRGEVRGGGKKPWKQKGTGRARAGSTRGPIWRGGGVVFGPSGNENYTKKLSTTSKRVAVRQALTLANQDKRIAVIDNFTFPGGKTKEALKLLADNEVSDKDKALLVVIEKNDLFNRATNNLQNLKPVRPTYLNVFDILNADKILITKESLPLIESWLTKEAK